MSHEVSTLLDELLIRSGEENCLGTVAAVDGSGIGPGDLPGDWRVEWEERAAVMEYDGGLPRERAEALALDDVLRRMRQAGEPGEKEGENSCITMPSG